ncbi:hypothetical protein PF004_g21796 [Phytophthora fragariae]|uniref:Uncharacterized protein n=2 Tax=Phytophthora fragariae TaxID=53985 RepID=A0A6G0N2S5_9STRA|nr:hypothetical protein PF004_g21796 [Phytophthora fragariae]
MAEMQMDAPDTGPPDPGIGQSAAQEITGISTSTQITGERREQGTESPGAASGGWANEGKAESQPMTWGDRVRNNNPDNEDITEVMARKSHMLEGVWNPIQQAHLVRTLMADWDITESETWTTDVVNMRQEAMAKAQDMHENVFNVSLTAVIPATVRMPRNAAHAVIFRELFMANTDRNTGQKMMRAFQRDVKRISYDGVQTITAVYYTRAAADRWTDKALLLQKAVIVLRNTHRKASDAGTGSYTPAQLELQYAIRVYGAEKLGLAATRRIFAQIVEAKILDVEYARKQSTEIYDNRYLTVRFAQRDCPDTLKGVARIKMGPHYLAIHHFQQHLRRPCTRCLGLRHGASKCTTSNAKLMMVKARATRTVEGNCEAVQTVSIHAYRAQSAEELIQLLIANTPQSPTTTLQLLKVEPEEPTPNAAQTEQLISVHKDAQQDNAQHQIEPVGGAKAGDGFKTHGPRRSKAAKAKARKAKREATASGQPATTKIEDNAGPGTLNTGSSEPTILGNLEYKRRQQPRRFERFQRAEALGRYEALAESESDSDEDGRSEMDVDTGTGGTSDEEAPYAYSGTTRGSDAEEFAVGSRKQDTETMVENTMTELLAGDVHMVEVSATDTADHGSTVTQEVTSSLRPKFSHTRKVTAKMNKKQRASSAGVGLQDGAIKGMQVSMANYMQRQTVVSTPSTPENPGDNSYGRTEREDSIIPATPDSQEEFTMGEPHAGTAAGDCDLPQF